MTDPAQAENAALTAFFDRMTEVYKARDLDGFVDSFDEEVVCLPPGQRPITGREAWRAWLSGWWNSTRVLEMDVDQRIDVDGDRAVEWHSERQVTAKAEGGEASELFFKGMFVLRRRANDGWRIARYCWNDLPAPD